VNGDVDKRQPTTMEKVKRVRAVGPGTGKGRHVGLDQGTNRGPDDGLWVDST
jgi:hypothetical protein